MHPLLRNLRDAAIESLAKAGKKSIGSVLEDVEEVAADVQKGVRRARERIDNHDTTPRGGRR